MDGSQRLVIDEHQGAFINTATGHSRTMAYAPAASPNELDFTNEKGKVQIVCTLSDDGESIQMVAQTSVGTRMYSFQRLH